MLGIRNIFASSANQAVTSSAVLVASELVASIAANQKARVRIILSFSVGAAGGFRFKLDAPAAPTNYLNIAEVTDGVTAAPGSVIGLIQTSAADFANAFASVAGNHKLEMDALIENGANAGDITFRFAQNSSNATAITLLRGAVMEVTYL